MGATSIRPPDLIVATSAGAINGAFIAGRPQSVETAEALAAIWQEVRRGQVFPLNPLTGLLGFLGARPHLVPDSGLRRLVEDHVETKRLEQLPVPLHVVAVDVITGEEALLSAGPLVETVMASSAIPAVMPPVPWEHRTLMDGGVANNTPISHAIALGAHEIYVLPTGHACALERAPGTALGMALHALSLLTHSRLITDIELHRHEAKLVVLPPPARSPSRRSTSATPQSSSSAPSTTPGRSSTTVAPSGRRSACGCTAMRAQATQPCRRLTRRRCRRLTRVPRHAEVRTAAPPSLSEHEPGPAKRDRESRGRRGRALAHRSPDGSRLPLGARRSARPRLHL